MQVQGASMRPTLEPGDRVFIAPAKRGEANPSIGSVVVSRHPNRPEVRMIKRLQGMEGDGLVLLGDNPAESSDSRQLGLIPRDHLIGTVTAYVRTRRPRSSAAKPPR